MGELWVGTVAPEVFDILVISPAGGLDLTTVSAASIQVYLPNGTLATWAATLVGATTTQLTVRHTFAVSPSDVLTPGTLVAYAHLTVPGGFIDTPRIEKTVRATWETP